MSRRWATIERPDAYLQRAVTNASSNWRRSGRRAAGKLHLLVARGPDDVPFDGLADAVARLPFRQRAVVVLRYYADMSEAEIALALDCRPGTVKSLSARALRHCRRRSSDDAPRRRSPHRTACRGAGAACPGTTRIGSRRRRTRPPAGTALAGSGRMPRAHRGGSRCRRPTARRSSTTSARRLRCPGHHAARTVCHLRCPGHHGANHNHRTARHAPTPDVGDGPPSERFHRTRDVHPGKAASRCGLRLQATHPHTAGRMGDHRWARPQALGSGRRNGIQCVDGGA